jgi:hypothetical protein
VVRPTAGATLEKINEALNEGLPARHSGFTNSIAAPDHAPVASSS